MKKSYVEFFVLAFSGIIAGYVNGLFGTGGGILLVFVLTRMLTQERGYTPRDIFATVIAAILPMSMVSAAFYLKSGSTGFNDAAPYLLSGIIGGIIGGVLLEHINIKFLKKLFAFMVIYAGVRMLVG